ncbi:ribosomal-processing cysteine protease Prp [Allobaculum sp. Allo2]|nr:ribosomal-processing cysteine protease Prp [Allobaculum sp. Allo2]UNT92234.1 ribosomal-processing cysteine protease Prp [Allobaculum sp. Allo2]
MIMIDTDLKTDIQIKGHAGYAPAGSDIVCAAVSILYETLKRMLRPGLDGTVIEDENGIRIEINPDLGTWGRVS